MTSSSTPARPRQLTVAAWTVVGGSLLLLVSVFDAYSRLRSVDTRDQIAQRLDTPLGRGLGVSVAEAVDGMQVGLTVAAVCAAAAAVLGYFVLQRHHGARIALSVVAVPLLLTAPLTGLLLGALVAAAAAATWSGQARDWFAGRPVRDASGTLFGPPRPRPDAGPSRNDRGPDQGPDQKPAPPAPEGDPAVPAADSLSTARPSEAPQATRGFGATPPPTQPTPTPWTAPGQGQAPRSPAYAAPGQRPFQVTVACLLTWIFSGIVAALALAFLVALTVDPDRFVDQVVALPEWKRLQASQDLLLPALYVDGVILLLWALGACLLAWFVWRRHGWARYVLAASAGVTLLAALLAFPAGMLHQLACALTIGGLFGRASRAWFDQPRRPSGPPAGGPPSHQEGPSAGSSDDGPAQGQDQPPTVSGSRSRPW